MKQIFVFLCIFGYSHSLSAQGTNNPGYAERAQRFLSSLDAGRLTLSHFSFDDSMRCIWERVPGVRRGLKLSMFTEQQKILLHELIRTCLSTQGYLTVTSVMFNEDIQQKFEPVLGKNEYWVEVFGDPSGKALWGWKLEGHHLSLNFTFKGNKMISNSPFLVATNPSNSITDSARAGLIILFKEEELARDLLNSLSGQQMNKAYSSRRKPDSVYSEQDRDQIHVPKEGIYFSELTLSQQMLVKKLAAEYFSNFNAGEIATVDQFCNKKLRFFYIDSKIKGKAHYYRLENGKQIIEYENYDNHIHCFWRTANDFGKEITRKKSSA
jgi:hypothetical protein